MPTHPEKYDFGEDDPWDDPWDESSSPSTRRNRVVRWTAILIVASFALAGLSSISHLW